MKSTTTTATTTHRLRDIARLAVSSDVWRNATTNAHCDLLLTLSPSLSIDVQKRLIEWLVPLLHEHEPGLRVEIRFHRLAESFALYLVGDYRTLLKAAEVCRIPKPVKGASGGELRPFCYSDAHHFVGVEVKSTFLSSAERSQLVRQLVDWVHAPEHGIAVQLSEPDEPPLRIAPHRSIIPELFAAGLLEQSVSLHEPASLDRLRASWLRSALWSEQPIDMLRDYFGTEIAFYFAWLAHLTSSYLAPSVLGVLIVLCQRNGWWCSGAADETDDGGEDEWSSLIAFVGFALFNCVWSTCYVASWKRRQSELAFDWATHDQPDPMAQQPRPLFQGSSIDRNPVTGVLEPFVPAWQRYAVRLLLSTPVTALCLLALSVATLGAFALQDVAKATFDGTYLEFVEHVPMIVYAILIIVGQRLFRLLAVHLTDLENERTEAEWEAALITKVVVFECVAAYGSLFYIAFYRQDLAQLRETLATLLLTRQLAGNVFETAVPWLMERFRLARLTYRLSHREHHRNDAAAGRAPRKETTTTATTTTTTTTTTTVSSTTPSLAPTRKTSLLLGSRAAAWQSQSILVEKLAAASDMDEAPSNETSPRLAMPEFRPAPPDAQSTMPELTQAELESLLSAYARPLDDYLEMFIQYGYVLLFSPAFPLAALAALANNVLELRVDAFKLCYTVQRPPARRVRDIGAWQTAFEVLSVAGIVVNTALVGQSDLIRRLWPDIDSSTQILLVILLEHLLLCVYLLLRIVVPAVPRRIRIEIARREHRRALALRNDGAGGGGGGGKVETSPESTRRPTVLMMGGWRSELRPRRAARSVRSPSAEPTSPAIDSTMHENGDMLLEGGNFPSPSIEKVHRHRSATPQSRRFTFACTAAARQRRTTPQSEESPTSSFQPN